MNRSLVIASAVVFASIGLAACGGGSDKGSDTASANTDAKTVVKVDGKDLTGVDLSNVGCAKQGDRFAIGAGGTDAINYFLGLKYIEALAGIGMAPNNKVTFLPLDASGVMGAISGIAELTKHVGGGDGVAKAVKPWGQS